MSGGIRKPGGARNPNNTLQEQRQRTSPVSASRRPAGGNSRGVRRPSSMVNTVEKPVKKTSEKAKKMRNKRYKVPLMILFVFILIGVVILSSFLSYTYLVDKYENPVTIESIYLDEATSVKFRIDKGMTTKEIADNLFDMGLIDNKTMYRFLSKFNGFDGQYKVGTYTLCDGLTYD